MHIDGETKVIGIIGHPIRHTLSPLIHNLISKEQGRNLVYVPFEVEKDVEAAIKGAYALGIVGMNVTVPYKSAVMNSLTGIEELAEQIGAVNTLVRGENGYKGYNTDISGLARELEAEQIEIENQHVLLLGAGGAARAAAFLCARNRAGSITILNRTLKKAEEIAEDIRCYLKDKNRDATEVTAMELGCYQSLPYTDYIAFQCTQLGLYPNTEQVVLEDAAFYKKIRAGVDLIYNPAVTRFMRLVRENGGLACNGLKMLLYQAVSAYELWNDTIVSEETVERVYEQLELQFDKKNYVLIGFMGAGKTTVGKRLAEYLHASFRDTDELIEEQMGMTVNEIFEQYGEPYFRGLETRLLMQLSKSLTNTVLSVGGGLPVKKENHSYLKNIGTVVYLEVSGKTVRKRLAKDTTRPLLIGDEEKVLERITALMQQRTPVYSALADRTVNTDSCDVKEIVEQIIRQKGQGQ